MSEYLRNLPREKYFKESDSLEPDFFIQSERDRRIKRDLNRYGEERLRPDPALDYSGIGPRGYERPGETIIDEACEILSSDSYLDASEMSVELKDRTLVLRGSVSSRRDKKRAEALVENIFGVEDVLNLLIPEKSSWKSN